MAVRITKKQSKRLKQATKHLQKQNLVTPAIIADNFEYYQTKKLTLVNYIATLLVAVIIIGLSFFFNYTWLKNEQKRDIFVLIALFVVLLLWIIFGAIKNREASRFFGDIRKRYLPTYTIREAKISKIRQVLLILALILLLSFLVMQYFLRK